jgi:AraC family transcriptional regulator
VRAREVLHERFREQLSLTELASEVGIHPAHFARGFRRYYRCSPGDYLRRLRVEEARRLLESTSEPCAMIAATCGFSDQSHLTRLFLRQVGTTPAAYRRRRIRYIRC